jgi:hypothetical protein
MSEPRTERTRAVSGLPDNERMPLTPRVRSVRGSTDSRGVIAQRHLGGTFPEITAQLSDSTVRVRANLRAPR